MVLWVIFENKSIYLRYKRCIYMKYEVLFRVINEDGKQTPWVKSTATAPLAKISEEDAYKLSMALYLYLQEFVHSSCLLRFFPLECDPTESSMGVPNTPLEDFSDMIEAERLIWEYLNRYPLGSQCIHSLLKLPVPKQP